MQSDLRGKLIEAFTKADGEFISGQEIAEHMGCSRTAVWKHIESLRGEGYVLEAVRKKGYKIVSTPEKVTADEIQLGMKTSRFGKVIHYEETVDSTQKIAHRLSNEGAAEGTLIVAEEQTGGKGRLLRSWHSPKYSGVWMSLILRPNIPFHEAPQLTLLAAVAVVQAIEEMTELKPEIKWPNDVLINKKKVTGILTELQAEADRIHSVIIGIGINVNQKLEDFPEELHAKASSLSMEEGKNISRAGLIQQVLLKLEKLYDLYLTKGFAPVKIMWESYAISLGKEITATTLNETIKGKALGITDEGVLLVRSQDGEIRRIYSADVEIT
ncbi:BirA family transcriptional regulator, biotin operon repressor / biotin-[acetyl-CoA-carboxylase] ligase [Bacillus sp. OV322]|uniref:biotin--[acetyl-CoA-carboxylase] ligase n=1 Tax=unclassified Bacillus (in: firmicutes) TaxID=185979 RepID=UPI0008F00555|nr:MULTISPECIES: biotin--[acetyl-CoA-carboxylase] ligase [unclassified Bacillus (in: firmicutes)]OIK12312.1 biotin--[acetyl-CoA-carboxylase] ligase [Bacillus sp. MUM 13]SFC45490.1 BirA family transcriptional regulator, biotin operon repressor / biotin-[acetyl-CoA-carboxylase] ligase [Bacillus sp. OV322]